MGLEMYWILEGEVEVFNERDTLLATLGKGNPLGEMALLDSDPDVRHAKVTAKTDVSLAVLDSSNFRLVLENYPLFREKVKRNALERNQ